MSKYIVVEDFGDCKRIWLKNEADITGMKVGTIGVGILTYGCIIQSIWICDKNGNKVNVTLGMPSLDDYKKHTGPYFGAIIGRYASRIDKGSFYLDGKQYSVDKNEGGYQTLHGGSRGWDKVNWEYTTVETAHDSKLILTHTSVDGDMGFPGKVLATVTYTVPKDRCEIIYEVDGRMGDDKSTVINMTNHAYFNLSGHGDSIEKDHSGQIMANKFVEVTDKNIPTGVLKCVENTPYDFREPKMFSKHINCMDDPDIKKAKGYDNCFMLTQEEGKSYRQVASFSSIKNGVQMSCWTDAPCGQLYTGNWIDVPGQYKERDGFAFETGNCASAMHNVGLLPNCVLTPKDNYHHKTSYRFSVLL